MKTPRKLTKNEKKYILDLVDNDIRPGTGRDNREERQLRDRYSELSDREKLRVEQKLESMKTVKLKN